MIADLSRARMWPLDDLAGVAELADIHGVARTTVCNWVTRYPDFPKPVLNLHAGKFWSRNQVAAWRTAHVQRSHKSPATTR